MMQRIANENAACLRRSYVNRQHFRLRSFAIKKTVPGKRSISKTRKLSSKPVPAEWSRDTGRQIHFFDSYQYQRCTYGCTKVLGSVARSVQLAYVQTWHSFSPHGLPNFLRYAAPLARLSRARASLTIKQSLNKDTDNKQLLHEVEHDIMNYQSRGLCYLPKPNTDTRFW